MAKDDSPLPPPRDSDAVAQEEKGGHQTTVVGIGASAGGLAALKEFFRNVPQDSGLAFVVVVHLSPEHKSHLAELLQPHVKNPVQQVTESVRLEANRIYVIPPNANINTIDTHLRLSPLDEELRSTMEELETSKEELQSMNEELQTVNQENRHKVEELAQLSCDLHNLRAATDIATLFLDRDFRIMRFTPKVGELFNVRRTDRGRPLSDITHRLVDSVLMEDAAHVLGKLVPVEREICDDAGQWYLTRVRPYRSSEDRIEGIVITFVDITERKGNEEALRRSEAAFRLLATAGSHVIYRMNPDWTHIRRLEGGGFIAVKETPDQSWLERYVPREDQAGVEETIQEAIRSKSVFELEHRALRENGTMGWAFSRAVPLLDENGEIQEWIGAATDVTDRRAAEESLRESEQQYRLVVEGAREYAIVMLDPEGCITMWNSGAERIFGYTEAEICGREGAILFTEEDRAKGTPEEEMEKAAREGGASDDRWHVRKDGSRFWANGVMEALRSAEGDLRGFVKLLRDNTEKKEVEEERRQMNERLESGIRERTLQVRELAARLSRAEQEERQRVSQILHDDLQQILCGVETKMAILQQELEDAGQTSQLELLETATGWLRQAIKTTRQLTVELSPPILGHEGLVDALGWLRRQMRDLHQLDLTLEATGHVVIEDSNLRVMLFQAVRELLFNVKKHGKTNRALVQVEESPDLLTIRVIDEGAGMDLDEVVSREGGGSGFGLFSIRERLRLLGGAASKSLHRGGKARVSNSEPLSPDPTSRSRTGSRPLRLR